MSTDIRQILSLSLGPDFARKCDTSLPQPWVDHVKNETGLALYGSCVYQYHDSALGRPLLMAMPAYRALENYMGFVYEEMAPVVGNELKLDHLMRLTMDGAVAYAQRTDNLASLEDVDITTRQLK